jgi:pimeloyl-ACP methyl ester carboxylesterase
MATFLICHGAWSGGWAWKKVRPLLRAAGHEAFTPTYTGLGDRAHQASPMVDLETHIQDVLAVIEYEELKDFVLVGHSYGGMVVTGVADRVPERVKHLVYLDAFVPADGQSLLDLRDLAWITPRRRPQPVKTFTQPLRLRNAAQSFPRSYIYCTKKTPDDVFLQFSRRLKQDRAWRYHEIDASHSPNVTAPEKLVRLLSEIAG